MDCVEVCPVDCFYEGENMLVIHPDECIDCGVCEPECPVEAISDDTDDSAKKWIDINKKYAEIWPNINKLVLLLKTEKTGRMFLINLKNILAKTWKGSQAYYLNFSLFVI